MKTMEKWAKKKNDGNYGKLENVSAKQLVSMIQKNGMKMPEKEIN